MKENELLQLLKYSSPNELYVVDEVNDLVRINCPFKVRVLIDIGAWLEGQFVFVESIKVTEQLITVYCIEGNLYWYYYFDIV